MRAQAVRRFYFMISSGRPSFLSSMMFYLADSFIFSDGILQLQTLPTSY